MKTNLMASREILKSLRQKLRADLYRIDGMRGVRAFWYSVFWLPSFRYVVLMRTCREFRRIPWLRCTIYPAFLFLYSSLGKSIGIRIPLDCEVGSGLLIEHWGCIWVSPAASIGCNCNISQGVTLGWGENGLNKGAPCLGDGVFLGPSSVVLGKVEVGNNSLISANSLVLQSVPENSVVIGVPGRVFSSQGSHELVKNKWISKNGLKRVC